MKFAATLIAPMALLASLAVGSPVPEPVESSDVEARACVSIRVFQQFDFQGASYDECLAPREVHKIRDGFRDNAGSFAVDSPGYVCTPGTPDHRSCDTSGAPGIQRLPSYCVNNIGNYYCNYAE